MSRRSQGRLAGLVRHVQPPGSKIVMRPRTAVTVEGAQRLAPPLHVMPGAETCSGSVVTATTCVAHAIAALRPLVLLTTGTGAATVVALLRGTAAERAVVAATDGAIAPRAWAAPSERAISPRARATAPERPVVATAAATATERSVSP